MKIPVISTVYSALRGHKDAWAGADKSNFYGI
jgi:hypothetical protein